MSYFIIIDITNPETPFEVQNEIQHTPLPPLRERYDGISYDESTRNLIEFGPSQFPTRADAETKVQELREVNPDRQYQIEQRFQ